MLLSNCIYACSGRYIDNRFEFGGDNDIDKSFLDSAPLIVENILIKKGTRVCPQEEEIKIEISLSHKHDYNISEIGFYLIPENNISGISYLPDFPLKAIKGIDGKYYLNFNWFYDSLRKKQKRIEFRIHTVDNVGYLHAGTQIYSIN